MGEGLGRRRITSAEVEQPKGVEADRSLTPLGFQDTKRHRAAQAEHMEVQERGRESRNSIRPITQ